MGQIYTDRIYFKSFVDPFRVVALKRRTDEGCLIIVEQVKVGVVCRVVKWNIDGSVGKHLIFRPINLDPGTVGIIRSVTKSTSLMTCLGCYFESMTSTLAALGKRMSGWTRDCTTRACERVVNMSVWTTTQPLRHRSAGPRPNCRTLPGVEIKNDGERLGITCANIPISSFARRVAR